MIFSHFSALVRHKRSHTGEEPFTQFKDEMCDSAFSQTSHHKGIIQGQDHTNASYVARYSSGLARHKTNSNWGKTLYV